MPRYKLTIEYDGTPFAGWQRQAGALVQQVDRGGDRQDVGRDCRHPGAGRTDSGVHALGQVVSFDLSKEWDPFRIREALNSHQAASGGDPSAEAVPQSFEARFSANRAALRISHLQSSRPTRARHFRSLALPDGARHRADARGGTADSASMISPRSARPSARRNRRRRRSTASMCPRRRDDRRAPRPAGSFTRRCARWSARWLVGEGRWSADDFAPP